MKVVNLSEIKEPWKFRGMYQRSPNTRPMHSMTTGYHKGPLVFQRRTAYKKE